MLGWDLYMGFWAVDGFARLMLTWMQLPTLNNFVLDPQRLQPTAATPAAIHDQVPTSLVGVMPNLAQSFGSTTIPSFNPAFNGVSAGKGGYGQGGGAGGGGGVNMMQQQMMMMMQMSQAMMMGMNGGGGGGVGAGVGGTGMGLGGGGRGGLQDRMGGFADTPLSDAPLPPPPPGGEDPRARRGRVSYRDLDEPGGGGDGGLPY